MKEDHLEQVVEVHLESFEGFFLSFLGRNFLRVFYRGVLHHENAIKLLFMDKGDVKGFIVGTLNPSDFYTSLLKRDWYKFLIAAIPSVLRKPQIIVRILRSLTKPSMTAKDPKIAELTSIAVRNIVQGQGVGKILVNAFLDECRNRSAEAVTLTTDADHNEKANAFYQNRGFKIRRVLCTPEKRSMYEYWFNIVP